MSVVRVGATTKYTENWDSIFSRSRKKKSAKPAASTKKAVGKKHAAKKKKR